MIDFRLSIKEKELLKGMISKKLIKYRHDPLDKFGDETVYGNIELFLIDEIILINYDYSPYPLFGNNNDDHPRFNITTINEDMAVSALQDIKQIDINCDEIINDIILVEEEVQVEWDGKIDEVKYTKAIIFKFCENQIALQGDYMIPLIQIIKGNNVKNLLIREADEFCDDPKIKYNSIRNYINLKNI